MNKRGWNSSSLNEKIAKEKKKCLWGELVALLLLAFSTGPANLALSRINVYLKQLASCSLADCVGRRREIGQKGVGWPPNPPRSQGFGPDGHPGVGPGSLTG